MTFVGDFDGIARHGKNLAHHGLAAFEREPYDILILDLCQTLGEFAHPVNGLLLELGCHRRIHNLDGRNGVNASDKRDSNYNQQEQEQQKDMALRILSLKPFNLSGKS
jgi:hypothetical protein